MLRKRNTKDPRSGNWVELQDYVPRFGIEEKACRNLCVAVRQEDF